MIERGLGVVEDYGGYFLAALVLAALIWAAFRFVRGSSLRWATLLVVSPVLAVCIYAAVWALWPRNPLDGEGTALVLAFSLMVGLPVLMLALAIDISRHLLRRNRGSRTSI